MSKTSKELLKSTHNNFFQLIKNKQDQQYLFTTQVYFDNPINRSSFDTEINRVLIKASCIFSTFNKHIRSHTFRASIITDYLKSTPIDVVKDIIGHKDIKTTLQYKKYKRGSIDQVQLNKILTAFDKQRSNESKVKDLFININKEERKSCDKQEKSSNK